MSGEVAAILAIGALILVPQAVGYGVARRIRGRGAAFWAWPASAAAAFAIGWYLYWIAAGGAASSRGGYVCGTAMQGFSRGLADFVVLTVVVAFGLQAILRAMERRRADAN